MILNIIKQPNPHLRLKARVLMNEEIGSAKIKQFIRDLGKTMLKEDGLGLAATQVDEQIRIFVVSTAEGVREFINPIIIKKSWWKKFGEEGCLSIPGIFGQVKRSSHVIVKYQDKTGAVQELTARDLLARVIQHELDHLEGILFIDRMKKNNNVEEQSSSFRRPPTRGGEISSVCL